MRWIDLPALPRTTNERVKRADIPAAAGEMVVVTAALAMASPYEYTPNCEPGLNPYQPNHRIITPKTKREVLCPGMSTTWEKKLVIYVFNTKVSQISVQRAVVATLLSGQSCKMKRRLQPLHLSWDCVRKSD